MGVVQLINKLENSKHNDSKENPVFTKTDETELNIISTHLALRIQSLSGEMMTPGTVVVDVLTARGLPQIDPLYANLPYVKGCLIVQGNKTDCEETQDAQDRSESGDPMWHPGTNYKPDNRVSLKFQGVTPAHEEEVYLHHVSNRFPV